MEFGGDAVSCQPRHQRVERFAYGDVVVQYYFGTNDEIDGVHVKLDAVYGELKVTHDVVGNMSSPDNFCLGTLSFYCR